MQFQIVKNETFYVYDSEDIRYNTQHTFENIYAAKTIEYSSMQ